MLDLLGAIICPHDILGALYRHSRLLYYVLGARLLGVSTPECYYSLWNLLLVLAVLRISWEFLFWQFFLLVPAPSPPRQLQPPR